MKPRAVLKYLVLVIVAANLALAAVMFLPGLASKPPPLPNPNGYDAFIKAGASLVEGDFSTTNQQELTGLVAQNEIALKFLHEGLTQECRVHLDYSHPRTMSAQLGSLKRCMLLLNDEGKLAAFDGRTNDAAKIHLEAVRYGQEVARGGPFINTLVGVACEAVSLGDLERLVDNLTAAQCAEVARALEAIDAEEESISDMLDGEKEFVRRAYSIHERLFALVNYKQMRDIRERVIVKVYANTSHRRQVMAAFAVRAYELDKGRRPSGFADLVPAYLKSIPQNPATGAALPFYP